jgi:hypothetical protein
MIPAARLIRVAVLRDHRILAEVIRDVRARARGYVHALGRGQSLFRRLDAPAQLDSWKQLDDVLDRLAAEQDARAGFLDLGLFRRPQQADEIDDDVGLLQGLDRTAVAAQRRLLVLAPGCGSNLGRLIWKAKAPRSWAAAR